MGRDCDTEVIDAYLEYGADSGEGKKLKKKKKKKDGKHEVSNGKDVMGSVESDVGVEKKKKKKKKHGIASENVGDESINMLGSLKANDGVEKKKVKKKKKKDLTGSVESDTAVEKKKKRKKHGIASEHVGDESINLMGSLKANDGVEKKKVKKKNREPEYEMAAVDVQTETTSVTSSAEVGNAAIKKKKKKKDKIPEVSKAVASGSVRTEDAYLTGLGYVAVHSVLKKKKKTQNLDGIAAQEMPSEKVDSGDKKNQRLETSGNSSVFDTDSKMKDKLKKRKKLHKNSDDHSAEKLGEKEGSKSLKKRKKIADATDSSEKKSKFKKKRVSFSDNVEVFTLPEHLKYRKLNSEGDVVHGKRYTPEEDAQIMQAVDDYIVEHGLAENGVDKDLDENWKKARKMVMTCKHSKLKGCWKEISLAIPWRTAHSIYQRAHLIYESSEDHKWSEDDINLIRNFHEKNGPKWRELGDFLGKSRKHVKDAYRRNKLSGEKKGAWSQEEYQKLFDLVNRDIRLKVVEEKKVKHGMLRDNIAWGAISESLGTRASPTCCNKWYYQLCSSMVVEGIWSDTDDYKLVDALYSQDDVCIEDVEWESLLEHRSGDLCKRRWAEMSRSLGEYRLKPFMEQVEILHQRYNHDLVEAREAYEKKDPVDV